MCHFSQQKVKACFFVPVNFNKTPRAPVLRFTVPFSLILAYFYNKTTRASVLRFSRSVGVTKKWLQYPNYKRVLFRCSVPSKSPFPQVDCTMRYGEAFFLVSRRFASRIHEISDLKQALVLSLRAGYTRLIDKKKHTEHERNATRDRMSVEFSKKRGPGFVLLSTSAAPALSCLRGLVG